MQSKDRIIVALDVDKTDKAASLVSQLAPFVGCFKVGLEFITAMIASIINAVDTRVVSERAMKIWTLFRLLDDKVFWDGKFDDIPNTVGAATKVVAGLGVKMLNVHASSGIESVMASVENRGKSEVLAVSVLTSFEENDANLNFGGPSKTKVLQFAREAKLAGCAGIICSPQELALLQKRKELRGLKKVTPGIRSAGSPPDDQNRTLPPKEAITAGADYLVIGRPITTAASPSDAAVQIAEEIRVGLKQRFHLTLFDLAKIKFGAFKLKLHEKNPAAPLSPIYLDIRELPEDVYELAGDVLHDLVVKEDLRFDYVIGIPKAGEPVGRALAKTMSKSFIRLEKIENPEGRKISHKVLDPFEPGKVVLLVDDLITHADTKLEAIEAVESNGLRVAGVVVLYDREQGGLKELNAKGQRGFAASTMSEVLEFYVAEKKIKAEKKAEVMAYIAAN